ncbi:MAG: HEPN domain-containing protein [Armatimonadetes bacterium]|nr:HEPN domain-containing protein [Armatimonadota bacterium]
MIRRAELRAVARERLRDAAALLRAGRYDAAVYMAGYVVELALKERMCRTLRWSGFPETRGEFQDYQSFRTHSLEVLLSLTGIEDRIRRRYLAEWTAVSDWNPEMRYNTTGAITRADAQLFVAAARTLLRVV